jgi:peptidoglycan hydrolase CwlO-like protein
MELNFLLSSHEAIISRFKQNKRFIEKEISSLFNQAKKMKKTCKDNAELTLSTLDEVQEKIRSVRK